MNQGTIGSICDPSAWPLVFNSVFLLCLVENGQIFTRESYAETNGDLPLIQLTECGGNSSHLPLPLHLGICREYLQGKLFKQTYQKISSKLSLLVTFMK